MDEMYSYADKALMSPENLMIPEEFHYQYYSGDRPPVDELGVQSEDEEANFSVIKAKIASHPSYPKLLDAYIDYQKVGAPPEIARLLDEIRREKDLSKQDSICIGLDPELSSTTLWKPTTTYYSSTNRIYLGPSMKQIIPHQHPNSAP